MQTLEQWLTVATRGLSDGAEARVRAEISDHYRSALESAQGGRVDAVEAERRAVAALGDPKTANRQYRRVLLTISDDFVLRGMMPPMYPEGVSKRRIFWVQTVLTLLLLDLAAGMAMLSIWTGRFGSFAALAAAIILHEVIFRTVHVRSIRAGWMIRVGRWGVLAAGATMPLLNGGASSGAAYWLLTFAYFEYKRFVLRGKLPIDQWPTRLYN